MKTLKQTLLGRFIPSISIFLFLQGCVVIGTYEEVTFHTECGEISIVAKIDSGAKWSSIDENLASTLCLEPRGDTVTIKSASGITERPLVEVFFTLAGHRIQSVANIADRSEMKYPVLIGVLDLEDRFLIRPETYPETEEAEEN